MGPITKRDPPDGKMGQIVYAGQTYSESKAMRPFGIENFAAEQVETRQIAMVVDIFMKDDEEWEYLEDYSTEYRVAFRKR